MPKIVSQLAQGNAFSRSADGGQLADSATRVWKVILNSPGEAWNINEAIGELRMTSTRRVRRGT